MSKRILSMMAAFLAAAALVLAQKPKSQKEVEALLAIQKGDSAKAIIYAERALEADPKYYLAMLLLSGELARSTREFDLDKEEKLARSEKYAKSAIELAGNAPKMNPNIPDDQWAGIKKDFVSQAHED